MGDRFHILQGLEPDGHVRPLIFDIGDARSLYFNFFGGLQSSMKRGQPSVLDVDYTKTMMGFMLAKPQPEDILMIGLGGGSLPKFCYHNLASRITVVEVNPHVIALRNEFEVPADDDRFRVVRADGAAYVQNLPSIFDVIIIDGFDEVGQPPQLCCRKFYQDCYHALKPGGLMVVNLHFNPSLAPIQESISDVFEGCIESLDAIEEGNLIVFASKRASLSTRSMSLSWALQNLNEPARDQLREEFQRILATFKTTEGQRQLANLE